MDQTKWYRSVLRISAVVTAAILLFQGGYINEQTAQLYIDTNDQLAAMVGASASVTPTELNQITAELTTQQRLLAQREDVIAEREIALGLQTDEPIQANETTTFILAAILFIQLLLIILNYGLDYLRHKEQLTTQQNRQFPA